MIENEIKKYGSYAGVAAPTQPAQVRDHHTQRATRPRTALFIIKHLVPKNKGMLKDKNKNKFFCDTLFTMHF